MISKVLAVIPIHNDPIINPYILRPLKGKNALARTIEFVKTMDVGIPEIDVSICLATNDPSIAQAVGAWPEVYVEKRSEEELNAAISEAVEQSDNYFGESFDLVLVLEPLHPLRPKHLARDAFEMILGNESLDSVVAVEPIKGRVWGGDQAPEPIFDTFGRDGREISSAFREMVGVFLLSRRAVIEDRHRVGKNVGLIVVDRIWGFVDVRDEENFEIAESLSEIFEDKLE
jgi:CMP-N-acetylneuraminic acid synthetase